MAIQDNSRVNRNNHDITSSASDGGDLREEARQLKQQRSHMPKPVDLPPQRRRSRSRSRSPERFQSDRNFNNDRRLPNPPPPPLRDAYARAPMAHDYQPTSRRYYDHNPYSNDRERGGHSNTR